MNHRPLKPKILFSISATIFSAALLNACETPTSAISMLGDPVPSIAASKTIVISPDTQYVNVASGDTVKFVINDKEFAWDFNGRPAGYAFNLEQVAPAGFLDHRVDAYVSPNPDYLGGGGA